MYTGLYLSVYTCNLVLDHFADATTAVQKRCAAELVCFVLMIISCWLIFGVLHHW